MYVHVNPCELEPISHAKTLNDQCEFVQYSVLESIFVAQEPHKFCSGSVRAKQVSARPSVFDRQPRHPQPSARPIPTYILVKIRIHATPHTTFSIRFFGPSAKVAKCGASRFPTQKNTSKIYIHAFSHTKSQIRFFGPFLPQGLKS